MQQKVTDNSGKQLRTRRGGGRPPAWKIQGKLCFQASASCSKIMKDKNISIQWKFSGQALFFRASASCSKFWMIKNMYSIQQGTLFCFSEERKLLKILNDKKYIFNKVNSGHTLFFRASASYSKILKDKKYFNAVKIFRGTSVFRASASCSKFWMIKNQWRAVRRGNGGSASPTIIMKCAKQIRDPN